MEINENKINELHLGIKCIKAETDFNYALDNIILVDRLPSSRGLGHIPFTDATGVQIPLGVPFIRAIRLFFLRQN